MPGWRSGSTKQFHDEERELRQQLRDGEANDEEEEYEAKEI